jgi:hypothetical protein
MIFYHKQNFKKIFLIILLLMCDKCSKNSHESDSVAIVADRVITANEFRERAELTPRQPYCQSNTERDKIIVLNTLIAEKILALESQNDSNLINNQSFQAYIKGRKEQYMREQLFYKEAFQSVKIDTTELQQAYKIAGRQYQLEFYTIDSSQAKKFQKLVRENPELKIEFFDNINLTSQPPIKKVSWLDNETPDILHQALFTAPLQINQILGPIQLDYNQYIILKILNWTDSPALGGQDIQHRWQMVKQKLKSGSA